VWKIWDLYNLKSWYAFNSKDFIDSWNPVIKIKNINNDTIDVEKTNYINDIIWDKAKKFLLNTWDILIAMTWATIWKIGLMPTTEKKCYLNQRAWKFFSKNSNLSNNSFLYWTLKQWNIFEHIVNLWQWAAQPNISGWQIENINLVIPINNIMINFQNILDWFFTEILNLQKQNYNLKQTRDLLLPKLVSGDFEVDDLDVKFE
jgi:type I restriction enzyme S subunit